MAASSTKRGPIKSTPNEQRKGTNQSTPTQMSRNPHLHQITTSGTSTKKRKAKL